MHPPKRKIVKSAVLIILILCVLGAIIYFRHALSLILVIPYFAGKLQNLGVNPYLAYSIALPLALIVIYSLSLVFSRDKEKRKSGYILSVSLFTAWCLTLYFITRDYHFDPKTGKAAICFAATPQGYEKVPCDWKYHPVYATIVFPANPDLVLAKQMQEKGYPEFTTLTPYMNMRWFTPDGRPLVWYYQDKETGKIDLFPYPGIHPQYGVELLPVNYTIVREVLRSLAERQPEKLHVHSSSKQPSEQSVNEQESSLKALRELSETLESLKPRSR